MIRGARVVGDARDAGASVRGADVVIDGRNRLVMPGLVNAHYHSHDVRARQFRSLVLDVWIALAVPAGREASPREVRLCTLLGAAECLLGGITTIQV